MRRVLAAAISVALQAAAIGAPLVHAHPDDHATEHHDGPAVHTHWAAHAERHHEAPLDGPALDTADHDRAVYIKAFIAVATPSFGLPGIVAQTFELPLSSERAAHRRIDDVRSHDPPAFSSLSPRAPPVFLS